MKAQDHTAKGGDTRIASIHVAPRETVTRVTPAVGRETPGNREEPQELLWKQQQNPKNHKPMFFKPQRLKRIFFTRNLLFPDRVSITSC